MQNRAITPIIPVISVLIIVSFGSWIGKAFPQTNEEVVEQFFPQWLLDESEEDFRKGGPRPFEASAFQLADLDGVGTEHYIVAAYTNGFSAAIRVLKLQDGNATLVSEPNIRLLGGIFPAVKLVDIETDGLPEVVVLFTSFRSSTIDWVFKWTGTELSLIGPSAVDKNGDEYTLLVDSDFVDIDGDGILEIITPPQHGPIPPGLEDEIKIDTYKLYSFDGQTYQLTKSLNYFDTFSPHTGAPVVDRSGFEVQDPGDEFILTIVNGEQGKDRVSGAVLRLNGVLIVGPNDLNQEVGQLVREVSVLQDNVVEVELRGEPEGQVTITVEPPKD